jgi:hypothetical protein
VRRKGVNVLEIGVVADAQLLRRMLLYVPERWARRKSLQVQRTETSMLTATRDVIPPAQCRRTDILDCPSSRRL